MDIVKRVLEEEQREAEKYKTIEVNKHLETKIDLGYLLCSDPNELDEKRLKYEIDHRIFIYEDYIYLTMNFANAIADSELIWICILFAEMPKRNI